MNLTGAQTQLNEIIVIKTGDRFIYIYTVHSRYSRLFVCPAFGLCSHHKCSACRLYLKLFRDWTYTRLSWPIICEGTRLVPQNAWLSWESDSAMAMNLNLYTNCTHSNPRVQPHMNWSHILHKHTDYKCSYWSISWIFGKGQKSLLLHTKNLLLLPVAGQMVSSVFESQEWYEIMKRDLKTTITIGVSKMFVYKEQNQFLS